MATQRILYELKEQVLNLLDDLLEICPHEPDILLVRLFFDNQVPPLQLMNEFITWVLPWEKQILAHDKSFFFDNDHIFGPLPKDKVDHFKVLIRTGVLDEDDTEVIFEFFTVYLSLIHKYKKLV